MAATGQDAYCTLLMSDNYLPGAMVLAHSLKDNGTKKDLAVLVTLDTLEAKTIEELRKVFNHIIPVERISNKSPANLYLMDRPDLASTFTKIALWRQTQFRRIVYIDADVVALRAPDELFNHDTDFAAVPDVGWPDCFNSGVLALTPNMGDYYGLLALAQRGISFDGADQGLLNMHFKNWSRISFTYNCTPSGHYQYVPAYKHFQSSINMVHFIGHDKPWIIGRETKSGASGVYEELLGRWWAVYDKHFRVPTAAYISGQSQKGLGNVQQHVKGELSTYDYGFSSFKPPPFKDQRQESNIPTTEEPLTENPELVESITQGELKPIPTVQQRQFSAPFSDWDPIRQPPPKESKPEAANFPSQTYQMSADRALFQAPKSYPEPPKGMWYEVPRTPAANEKPKPIFPWEENQSKPARVFADDMSLSSEPSLSLSTDDETQAEDDTSPSTPTIRITAAEPFSSYSRTNAWDEMPEIERYISAITANRRAKTQILSNIAANDEEVLSPGIEKGVAGRRRPSMKLTDFPTAVERPSLPVTPAPIRRPSFWGEEKDMDLPGAEGVPKQEEWDPIAKLEELQRRQSAVLAQGPTSPSKTLPDRELPEHATLLPTSEETIIPPTSMVNSQPIQSSPPTKALTASPLPTSTKNPLISDSSALGPSLPDNHVLKFDQQDFTGRDVGKSGEDEGVFSPTES